MLFDPNAPVVTGIARLDANPTNATSVRRRVTFSEPVSGVDASDFALDAAGIAGAAISDVQGSDACYTVTAGADSSDGADGQLSRDIANDERRR